MARTASAKLTTIAARRRLDPRAASMPYFFSVAPKRLLGYVRTHSAAPGYWIVQQETERDANGKPTRSRSRLALADDFGPADGRDVMDFQQAFNAAGGAGFAAGPRHAITLGDAIDAYVKALASAKGEAASLDAKIRLAKHVPQALRRTAINRLTLSALRTWRDKTKQGDDEGELSPATVNRIIANLKAALNHAYRDESHGIASDRAWHRLESFKDAHRAREHHFSEGEVARLAQAANRIDPHFARLVVAGYLTGARYGELAACDVRHLDARRRLLAVPSGKTGARAVTLTEEAARLFADAAKGRDATAPLFMRADGERWAKSHQHRPMKAALKAAKLDVKASFYALRHTYISRAIEAGMPMLLVAQNCGTSAKMIELTYGKFLASARRELIEQNGPRLGLRLKAAA